LSRIRAAPNRRANEVRHLPGSGGCNSQ
jgi:hypothetical protein